MNLKIATTACCLFLLTACSDENPISVIPTSPAQKEGPVMVNSSPEALSNVVLVKFQEDAVTEVESTLQANPGMCVATRSGISRFDSFLDEVGGIGIERLFPVTRFEERTRRAGLHRWYKVRFNSSISPKDIENKLKDINELSVVQFALPLVINDNEKPVILREGTMPQTRANNNETPISNDTYIDMQWSLRNDGTLLEGAKAGADINVAGAWQRSTGDPHVIVAVLDEGVQAKHPDLAANMWVNEAELNGKPGVDDDGNGYVDDIHGMNFSSDVSEIPVGSHGTHVAGTIAAVRNNSMGVAGIAGGGDKGDGVRIMTCCISSASAGNPFAASEAAKYAADNGAVICQNSWGYSGYVDWLNDTSESISAEREAFQYFIDYAGKDEEGNVTGPLDGGLVVFAAGNYGHINGKNPFWPAAYPDFISVANIAADYNPSYSTGHGNWVKLSAPGGDMTFMPDDRGYSGILSTCIGASDEDYVFAFMSGTSMACPHVSGVAALAASYAYQQGRILTATELKNIILEATNPIDEYFNGTKVDNGNFTGYSFRLDMADYKNLMGVGLIDASKALDNVDILIGGVPPTHTAPVAVKEDDIKLVEATTTTLTVKWKVTADCEGNPLPLYKAYIGLKPIDYNNRGDIADVEYLGPDLINTTGLKVGDEITWTTFPIPSDLDYYVGIIGVDKWRQVSPIANAGTFATLPEPNIPPVITPETTLPAELKIQYWQDCTLVFNVTDEDDEEWTIALNDPTGSWSLKRQGVRVTLTYDRSKGYVGSTVISLVATDRRGAQTELKIPFTVVANVAPVLSSQLPDVSIQGAGQTATVDLDNYFSDANAEPLQYLCTTSGAAATATVNDGILTLKAKQNGQTTVSVKARDIAGETVGTSFKVTVGPIDPATALTLYPNPVSDVLNIRINANVAGNAQIRIFSATGTVVWKTVAEFTAGKATSLNVSSLNPGSYILEINHQGNLYKGNFIKK